MFITKEHSRNKKFQGFSIFFFNISGLSRHPGLDPISLRGGKEILKNIYISP